MKRCDLSPFPEPCNVLTAERPLPFRLRELSDLRHALVGPSSRIHMTCAPLCAACYSTIRTPLILRSTTAAAFDSP